VTLPEPGLPDEAATAEYWKGIAEAAVELAKASVAADLADGTWDRQERADLRKAAEDEYVARRKDETSADLDIHKQVLAAMIEVAKGSIERSRDSAKFVQASAAALATGYTTLLAVVFSIKDHPLPPRGFIPTIFLGLATALATAYLAFLAHPQDTKVPPPSDFPRENSLRRVVLLIRWTGASVYNRARFLRAAVVALLLGVMFLPVAVISISAAPAAASTTTSSASPSPGAPAIAPSSSAPTPSWPAAPSGSPDAYSVELYKAQLAAHVASLTASTTVSATPLADEDPRVEQIAWVLFVIGIGAVIYVVLDKTREKAPPQPPTPPRPRKPGPVIPAAETVPGVEEIEEPQIG
jgi:hypothetical protein